MSVGRKGGKLHFHAPIEALVFFYYLAVWSDLQLDKSISVLMSKYNNLEFVVVVSAGGSATANLHSFVKGRRQKVAFLGLYHRVSTARQ